MTQPAISFKDNVGLVHMQAKRGFKWAQGAGLSLDYDDMFQEASLAFVVAANGFDPDTGLKFSTYFTKVAFSEFRKSIGLMSGVKNLNPGQRTEIAARNEENARRAAAAQEPLPNMNYGLNAIPFSALDGSGDEEGSIFESGIEGSAMTPEEILDFKQTFEQAKGKLSPLARLVMDWLIDPPAEMVRELACQDAYAEECVAQGVRSGTRRDGVTIASIGKFLCLTGEVTKGQVMLAEAELRQVAKQI